MSDVRRLGALFFPGFELLDTFGPLEMFGNCQGAIDVVTVAGAAGPVRSAQGPEVVAQYGLADCPPLDLLLVPGGIGTRDAAQDDVLVDWVRTRSDAAELVMTVCTGTALPAQAGLLDGRRATTNKAVFSWLETTWPNVRWVRAARWVEDGKFVTSSGVSAGIDMALAVIAKLLSPQLADGLALGTEYEWHRDAGWDPFAKAHGLV
ncbi:MAG: DJ-1/PfpI family protein [bacterium]|nr:DJ-1/PfpI family protein [bacterium]